MAETNLGKGVISVAVAGVVMATLAGGIWKLAILANRVEVAERINERQDDRVNDLPTRNEFGALQKKIDEISIDVKQLISKR